LAVFKYLVTRQLSGYSGDFYLNVDHEPLFHTLYDGIMDGSINQINSLTPTRDGLNTTVYFDVKDKLIDQSFNVHIKKNTGNDGLKLRMTDYIKHMITTPSQILIIFVSIDTSRCSFYVKSECPYKYILEKHQTENRYRITMAEVTNPKAWLGIEKTTGNMDSYLANFNIINTGDRSLKWQSTFFNSYEAVDYNKKHIGVPYTNEHDLVCDSFDKIEDIL